MPPPIPTMRPARIWGKDDAMSLATAAGGIWPYMPAGSEAITILWTPMRPHEYALLSLGGFVKSDELVVLLIQHGLCCGSFAWQGGNPAHGIFVPVE